MRVRHRRFFRKFINMDRSILATHANIFVSNMDDKHVWLSVYIKNASVSTWLTKEEALTIVGFLSENIAELDK